jgi:prophage regulatory protein
MTISINELPNGETLPVDGMSRLSQFKKFLPFSRETFRKLSLEGKAPRPQRMGVRCTFYSNRELHKFLIDPLNYRVSE